jgi:Cu(I)-responsive transcriptional regulator
MNISQAAKQTGISAKMIRYYEEINLIPNVLRTDAGYRVFNAHDIERLRFIHQSRNLGFSLEQIKLLLQLQNNSERNSADVKALAQHHVDELESKIAQMQQLVMHLRSIIKKCQGNDQPECAILDAIKAK